MTTEMAVRTQLDCAGTRIGELGDELEYMAYRQVARCCWRVWPPRGRRCPADLSYVLVCAPAWRASLPPRPGGV
jgi:hypothetical protein